MTYYLIFGVLLGTLFLLFARKNSEKEVFLWSWGLIIVALVYILFGLIWGDSTWVGIEIVGVLIYSSFLLLSRKFGLIWIAIGWLLHPVWDFGLHWMYSGYDIAPEWYTIPCLSFDVVVGLYIIYRLFAQRSKKKK